VVKLLGC